MLNCNYNSTLAEAGVPKDKREDCLKWAFGDDYLKMDLVDTPDVWNKRHGHMIELDSRDNVLLSIYTIGGMYMMR